MTRIHLPPPARLVVVGVVVLLVGIATIECPWVALVLAAILWALWLYLIHRTNTEKKRNIHNG
jgi:hypothetical protein